MKLKCLSSGSKGNCYILEANNGKKLIIESGIMFKQIQEALNFSFKDVVCCLVSHRHQDHAKALQSFLKYGVRVLSIEDVFASQSLKNKPFCKVIEPMHGYIVGDFKIFVLQMNHDVPCVGFIIEHTEMGRLLFATDTADIEDELPQLDHIMIECNYSSDVLNYNIESGVVHAEMGNRLAISHMELSTCKRVLMESDLSQTKEIVLLHLSSNNSRADEFKQCITKATGKVVYIADSKLNIELTKEPY